MNAVPGTSQVHQCRSCVQGVPWDLYLGYVRHAMQGAGTCAVTAELHPKLARLLLSTYKSLCLSRTYRRQRTELTCVKLGFLAQDL